MLSGILYRFAKRRSRRHLTTWLDEAITLASLTPVHRMINVGAGGEIDAHFVSRGFAIPSVDIDPERRPNLLASVEDLNPLEDASLDAVFCLEVLEHTSNPQAAASAIRRVLRPGGWFIGSTPFLLGIHDAPNDYFRFTEYGLRHLFRDLELVALRPRNGYFDSIAVLLYRRFVIGIPSMRRRSIVLFPVLLALGLLIEGLGKVIHADDGTTGYFFVFRKKQHE